MTELLIFAFIMNALMDAIDHEKGAKNLGWVWHISKWGLFFPSLFWAGHLFKNNYLSLIISLLVSILLWVLVYNLLRIIFKKYGVPGWF
jgi:Kef-type K+ transport system membrane component KefB